MFSVIPLKRRGFVEEGAFFSNYSVVCLHVAPSVKLLLFPQLEFLDRRDWSFTALPVFAQMESAAKAPTFTAYNYSKTVLLSQQWDITLSLCIFLSNYCYSSCGNSSFHPLLYLLLHCAKL